MADWLFSSGECSVASDFADRERIGFRHGAAKAYLEETPVLPGIWLYRGEASAGVRFGVDVDGGPPGHGRMILGAMLSSRGVASLEGCDEQAWRDDGRAYIMTPMERRVRYDIEAERSWRAVAVRLEQEALDLLGAGGGLPNMVRQALEGRRDDILEMAPLSGGLRALGHAMLRSPYGGRMNSVFRQAKVLEMLALQFSALGSKSGNSAFSPGELAKVRMARESLLSDLRDPPDLERLARDVGLSAKRLNRGFRALFGTTVFDYLRDARLDAARSALEAGTPLSLKQLAWEMGYGQVSNFVTAFRRRFGVTPGSYRAGSIEDYAQRH